MNSTLSITQEMNSLILPVISVACQLVLALILMCIKKLEHNNYMKLNQMQECILDTVSKSGQMSTSRREAQITQELNEPYDNISEPASTHRDIPLNNDYVLRIKK